MWVVGGEWGCGGGWVVWWWVVGALASKVRRFCYNFGIFKLQVLVGIWSLQFTDYGWVCSKERGGGALAKPKSVRAVLPSYRPPHHPPYHRTTAPPISTQSLRGTKSVRAVLPSCRPPCPVTITITITIPIPIPPPRTSADRKREPHGGLRWSAGQTHRLLQHSHDMRKNVARAGRAVGTQK